MEATVTGVGVLDKGMAIINSVEFGSRSATELARELDMTLPTVHRLAAALVEHGLLRRDAEGRYSVGVRFEMSAMVVAARPLLEDLRDRTQETAQLFARRGENRLCLESVDSGHELRATLPKGRQLPFSDGGSAALVLTGKDVRQQGRIGRGWIETVSQRTAGLGSVSAPVRLGRQVVAAICLVAPLARLETTPGEQWGDLVVDAANALSRRIG
ncbi:IclR family transcriptional regulator [Arthrobacter pigmenti]